MNYTMLTDFYELTMANGYFREGMGDKIAYFDMFFRQVPDGAGFAVMAGVEQLVEYMKNLKFEPEDIEFLRSKNIFDEGFLKYLENFKFSCDVWAVPEGTPIFPNEPIVTVRGPLIQAQFLETMVLLTVNHQSLIATKSNRIVRAALWNSAQDAHRAMTAQYTVRERRISAVFAVRRVQFRIRCFPFRHSEQWRTVGYSLSTASMTHLSRMPKAIQITVCF